MDVSRERPTRCRSDQKWKALSENSLSPRRLRRNEGVVCVNRFCGDDIFWVEIKDSLDRDCYNYNSNNNNNSNNNYTRLPIDECNKSTRCRV